MLAIDDLKKLADMQIRLLKITTNDREINLKKYKDLIVQIDQCAFEDFLSGLNQVNTYNQPLESELEYLKQISEDYQRILEKQLEYKRNCELYGDDSLDLSDLSIINIDYINDRIKNIDGYLTNNIELNKCRISLEKLNVELLSEEKNKQLFCDKMLQLDDKLRSNFISAEGRIIVDGQLQYTSVVSEYKELGYNVQQLLDNVDQLDKLLLEANVELDDAEDKLKVAEMCYKNDFSGSNFSILDDIKIETLKMRYRVSMLKILKLLLDNSTEVKLFKEKRENLLDLINHRVYCLNSLGIKFSIDPFDGIKIGEQIQLTSSFEDNLENISRIKKEIFQLDSLLERLVSKKSECMNKLNSKEDIISKPKIDLIDNSFSNDEIDNDEIIDTIKVLDNQVVLVKDMSQDFNKSIVAQKTRKVIKRVNEMVNVTAAPTKKEKSVELSPELVIVQEKVSDTKEDLLIDASLKVENIDLVDEMFNNFSENEDDVFDNTEVINIDSNEDIDDTSLDIDTSLYMPSIAEFTEDSDENIFVDSDTKEDVREGEDVIFIDENVNDVDSDIFMTVDPFVEAPFYNDRVDDDVESNEFFVSVDNIVEDNIIPMNEIGNDTDLIDNENNFDTIDKEMKIDDLKEEMPDAFWVVEDDENNTETEDMILSFDEQVDKLMEEDNVKIRKLAA